MQLPRTRPEPFKAMSKVVMPWTARGIRMINPLPRRLARMVSVIACAFLAASCDDLNADRDREFEILVHPDAIEVELYHGLFSNPPGVEYKVNMTYPEMAIDGPRRNALFDLGWKECRYWSDTWQVFMDERRADNPHCKYQDIRYLVKGSSLMLITLSYTDEVTENNSCSKTPANTLQTVSVMTLEDVDVESEIKRLGVTCGL